MSTVSISYDLAKDDEAQSFRIAVAAEDLFSALIDFYLLAVKSRDRRAKAQPAHTVRALLRDRLARRTAAWALKGNALDPRGWRRPGRIATLTVDIGFPYLALLNAEGIFTAIRALDASFKPDETPVAWKDMVSITLAKLDENGVAAAFEAEVSSRNSKGKTMRAKLRS